MAKSIGLVTSVGAQSTPQNYAHALIGQLRVRATSQKSSFHRANGSRFDKLRPVAYLTLPGSLRSFLTCSCTAATISSSMRGAQAAGNP
jgi:hypothetical protein